MGIETDRNHHELPAHEVLVLVETDAHVGLDAGEARDRLRRFGHNVLPPVHRRGPLLRFLLQFHNPLIYILLVAAAATLALGETVDAGVILGVVLINAVIGYVQESRAEAALDALVAMTRTAATVVRDGTTRRISSDDVVPGDLVMLEAGDKVPADLRLIEVEDLEVDESALTGESVAARKEQTVLPTGTVLGDRANMAYSSTLVSRGRGRGVAVATGAQTEIGTIHRLVGTATDVETPLTRKIAQFSKLLTVAILALAAVTFAIGFARGEPAGEMLTAAVALAVGAIPEGLPPVVTITLAIGVSRMARRHAIVRKLPAVETLGGTTVICTDKTGTLTRNEMTVRELWAGGEAFQVTGDGYSPGGRLERDGRRVDVATVPAVRDCLVAGVACNDTRIDDRDGGVEVVGDPTEAALLVSGAHADVDRESVAEALPRLDSLPFESETRYMATLHEPDGSGPPVVYIKGATEMIVGLADAQLDADGAQIDLDAGRILAEANALAGRALRVLAFARAELPKEAGLGHDHLREAHVVFLGLQAMADPPRSEAVSAVAACRSAGIGVKMVTGDHVATARAIADEFGLVESAGDGQTAGAVMDGNDLAACGDDDLPDAAERASVFARVSPEQKLRLVRALQSRGHVVAMTGDGVNDAPALRQADIGIAMGRSGTEVAKEASDMVLTDDNFATIEAAAEEGRGVFDNLTKFIVWALPTSMGEGLVILVAIIAGSTLPILPVQVLWVNMTTAVALGIALAFEPRESDVMLRPPRDPSMPLLTPALVWRIALVSFLMVLGAFGLFHLELANGASDAAARTVAVNVFVMIELTYLFNCRSLERSIVSVGVFSNRWVIAGSLAMIVLQVLFTYVPAMNTLFHTAPINVGAWARIAAVAVGVFAVVGTEKLLRRARARVADGR